MRVLECIVAAIYTGASAITFAGEPLGRVEYGDMKAQHNRPRQLCCCASNPETQSCFGAAMAHRWVQHLAMQGPMDLRPGGAALAGAAGRIAA